MRKQNSNYLKSVKYQMSFGSLLLSTLFILFIFYGCEESDKDDEEIPPYGLLIFETNDSTIVSEDGDTDIYNLTLRSEPTSNVSVEIETDGQTEVSSKLEIEFTVVNWNVPQEITVNAIDDSIHENDHISIVTHSLSSSDANFDGEDVELEVYVLENEFSRIISGSRVGRYCVVDPVTGEDLAEPDPDVHYVGQLGLGYLSKKAFILSPPGPGTGSQVLYSCDPLTGDNVVQLISEDDYWVFNMDGSDVEPRIVFSAKDVVDWHLHIHAINEDGTNLEQLTFHEEGIDCQTKVSTKLIAADYPVWSPDGSKIAFAGHLREIDTNFPHAAIIIMDSDGSNKTVLYSEPVEEPWYRDICWTRQGDFLIFSQADGGDRAVKALHVASNEITEFSDDMQAIDLGVQNHWTSPMENKIVYMLISPGGSDLYVVEYEISGNNFSIINGPYQLTDELAVGHGYQKPDWVEWVRE